MLNHTRCRLSSAYAGQCSAIGSRRTRALLPPPCELATFHTTCTANLSVKLQLMSAMLAETAACGSGAVAGREGARRLHAGGHCCTYAELRYEKVGRKASWEACLDACRAIPGCRIFSYSERQQRCTACKHCDVSREHGGYDSWELTREIGRV